jgi:hypothetical protein
MAALEDLNVGSLIRRHINDGKTHKDIAEELRHLFPGARGVSSRSVRRFCLKHNLHATSRLPIQALDILVGYGIGMVCVESDDSLLTAAPAFRHASATHTPPCLELIFSPNFFWRRFRLESFHSLQGSEFVQTLSMI